MIPIGLIAVAVRAATRASSQGQPAKKITPAQAARSNAMMVWLIGPIAFMICVGLMSDGFLWAGLGLPICALVFWPWAIVRFVAMPLGLPRFALALTRFAQFVWRRDTKGGPVVAAAWTVLRQKNRDPALLEKLQSRVNAGSMTRGGTLVAAGLLAACRNDLEAARHLLSSVESLHENALPRIAQKLAREWLMADAAERGDWKAVLAWGRRKGPLTATSRLLYGTAARLQGEPYGYAHLRLWTWWLLGGRWRATWPILRRGLDAVPPPRPVEARMPLKGAEPLQAAMPLHVALLQMPAKQVRAPQLVALGKAWDAVLADKAVDERIRARALSLAMLPTDEPLEQLRETITNDLLAVAREARLPAARWTGQSALLDRVADQLREELVSAVEDMSRRMGLRVEAKKALPILDEWREWIELRRAYEEALTVGGIDARRVLFAQAHHDVCGLAVWLYNKRDEKPLGNAMLTWLLAEAKAVGDAEAIKLQTKNVGLGCGV